MNTPSRWITRLGVGLVGLGLVSGACSSTDTGDPSVAGTLQTTTSTVAVTTNSTAPITTSTTAPTVPVGEEAEDVFGRLIPSSRVEDDRLVVPLTFPDGSSVELSVPSDVDITSHGLVPYWSGRSPGFGRDFWVIFTEEEEIIHRLTTLEPELLKSYSDGRGGNVNFWRFPDDPDADFLAFEFKGPWTVLVYDYREGAAGPRMSDADRQLWAMSLDGETDDGGFLILRADPPLSLAEPGHGGPELHLAGASVGIGLYRIDCEQSVEPSLGPNADSLSWCDDQTGIQVSVAGSEATMLRLMREMRIRADSR